MALVALGLPLVGGCLFEARDAEPPGTTGENQIPLDDPTDVFSAIRQSLETQLAGNYDNALSDNFVFLPLINDEQDPIFPQGIFDDWTKQVEKDVLQQMFGDFGTMSVSFTTSRDINQNDYVRFRAEYDLITTDAGAPMDSTRYRAVAHIDTRNESGNWRIDRWEEIEQVAAPGGGFYRSWGFLRGTVREKLGG